MYRLELIIRVFRRRISANFPGFNIPFVPSVTDFQVPINGRMMHELDILTDSPLPDCANWRGTKSFLQPYALGSADVLKVTYDHAGLQVGSVCGKDRWIPLCVSRSI
jgi:hypothetical protein